MSFLLFDSLEETLLSPRRRCTSGPCWSGRERRSRL